MENILIVIFVYLGYLILWSLICLLAFTLSLILKKPSIMHIVSGISTVIVYLLNFLIGIGLLIYVGSLLFSGEFLWFIIMLFVGISVVTWLLSLLQMPFILIPSYFAEKAESIEGEEDVVKGEVLDEHHKIIAVTEGEKDISRRLAIYFVAVYGLNLLSLFMNRQDYPTYMWGDYLLSPFLWVVSQIVFFGLIIGIYFKIRKGKFFHPRKKVFLISVLKVTTIVLIIFSILFLLVGVWQI
jgi:hypothetical protein